MSSIRDLLFSPENLTWAWRKARHHYRAGDGLVDQGEIAAFDLDLEAELASILADFRKGTYSLQPLRLLPQPKKPGVDGKPRMRQNFQVSVRDQVAWIAVVNAIGPALDQQMPQWSYGNRLYRATWYEDVGPTSKKLVVGPYRHTSGHLYRKFTHSWPLFRRHVSVTARVMGTGKIDREQLNEGELRALDQAYGLPYLDPRYWSGKKRDGSNVYHASIDLEKFFPRVSTDCVFNGICEHLPEVSSDKKLRGLIKTLLDFNVTLEGISEDLRLAPEPTVIEGRFNNIPTGLIVSGFLANVAMLPVDKKVKKLIGEDRDLAHFRFVDDHTILAFDFDRLCDWIRKYKEILENCGIEACIAEDKFDPPDLIHALGPSNPDNSKFLEAKEKCRIDGRMPSQLMTRTLAQVSMLAAADFEILSDPTRMQRMEQLEWLLLANIPETEVRSDTRATFAAGRIAALAPTLHLPNQELTEVARLIGEQVEKNKEDPEYSKKLEYLQKRKIDLLNDDKKSWQKHAGYYFSLLFHAFAEHPDKFRLFARLLEYCRVTGYNGIKPIAEWMLRHSQGDLTFITKYLGSFFLQILSAHLVRCARDCLRRDLLHRETEAAREHLLNIANLDVAIFVPTRKTSGEEPEFFQQAALDAFRVGLAAAAKILEDDPDHKNVLAQLEKLKLQVRATPWEASTKEWQEKTGWPAGVWVHWVEAAINPQAKQPTSVWKAAAPHLDVRNKLDWNNIRRFPSLLPENAWERLEPSMFRPDDGGWLLEAARASREQFSRLESKVSPARQVAQSLRSKKSTHLPLLDWVEHVRGLEPYDPRHSEWTNLEILRQLMVRIGSFGAGSLRDLDHIHPANVDVPVSWLCKSNSDQSLAPVLTWERWRHTARDQLDVRIRRDGIQDFRFGTFSRIGGSRPDSWARHLAALGHLLWGLLRHDFSFPGSWNIRGQERILTGLIGKDLERLPVSSLTTAILEACLLPRSRETAFITMFPALFGADDEEDPNDVLFDPPVLRNPGHLEKCLEVAQAELVSGQITVLHHQPRQIVPVSIAQIARSRLAGTTEVEAVS